MLNASRHDLPEEFQEVRIEMHEPGARPKLS